MHFSGLQLLWLPEWNSVFGVQVPGTVEHGELEGSAECRGRKDTQGQSGHAATKAWGTPQWLLHRWDDAESLMGGQGRASVESFKAMGTQTPVALHPGGQNHTTTMFLWRDLSHRRVDSRIWFELSVFFFFFSFLANIRCVFLT